MKCLWCSRDSFLSLTLPREDVPSPSAAAFLFGVYRLSSPRPSGPGESPRGEVGGSSFGHILQQEGVREPASLPWGCTGEVTAVCRHLNTIFFLLLSMLKILNQHTVGKRNKQTCVTICNQRTWNHYYKNTQDKKMQCSLILATFANFCVINYLSKSTKLAFIQLGVIQVS